MAKFDLSDGFYRIKLAPHAALSLAVLLPGLDDHNHLIGIPLSLPMGWTDSPPYFSAFTETAADIGNAAITHGPLVPPPHPLRSGVAVTPGSPTQAIHLSSPTPPPTKADLASPLGYLDVYVDDFIGLTHASTAARTLRCILHAISAIFRQEPHPDDATTRKQIISQSKPAQGDGAWSTEKVILGWLFNSTTKTHALPPIKWSAFRRCLPPSFLFSAPPVASGNNYSVNYIIWPSPCGARRSFSPSSNTCSRTNPMRLVFAFTRLLSLPSPIGLP
jgi:hypothetical protein